MALEYKLPYTASEIEEKLGKVATPDYSINDPEAAGYIANRTHYSEIKDGNIEFYGNVDEYEAFYPYGEGMAYVKIADNIFTEEDLTGQIFTYVINLRYDENIDDYVIVDEYTQDVIISSDNMHKESIDENNYVINIYDDESECEILIVVGDMALWNLPPQGIYFSYANYEPFYCYVKSLSCLTGTQEIVHKIDKKYLPKLPKTMPPSEHEHQQYVQFKTTVANVINSELCTSVVYGVDKFVTGRRFGTAYSEDGINWTQVWPEQTNNKDWHSVIYGNGKFVASVDNYIISSEDGVNWQNLIQLPHKIVSIKYCNNKFLAIADSNIRTVTYPNTIYYSDDAVNWNASSPLPANVYWKDVAYGNGKYVVVAGDVGHTSKIFAYSEDLINWEEIVFSYTSDSGAWSSIIYDGNKFVAFDCGTSSNRLLYSKDCSTWTNSGFPDMEDGNRSVSYAGNKFFISGGAESGVKDFYYSEDGLNWKKAISPPIVDSWSNLAYGNGKYIIVGKQGNVLYSKDCSVWTDRYVEIDQDGTTVTPEEVGLASIEYVDKAIMSIWDIINLISPDGHKYKIIVSDTGYLTTSEVTY